MAYNSASNTEALHFFFVCAVDPTQQQSKQEQQRFRFEAARHLACKMNDRERIEELEAEIANLKRLLAAREDGIDSRWKFDRQERRLFSALSRGSVVSRDILISNLYHDYDSDKLPDDEGTCLESRISKMRRKLKPYGISIRALRHVGYQMEGYTK